MYDYDAYGNILVTQQDKRVLELRMMHDFMISDTPIFGNTEIDRQILELGYHFAIFTEIQMYEKRNMAKSA